MRTTATMEDLPDVLDGVPVQIVQEGQAAEAPEIVAAQDAASAVVDRAGRDLLARPGVTAVGVGYKKVGTQVQTNVVALKVFVAAKLSGDELAQRNWEVIPKEIDGVVTDVEELPPMRPTSASGSRADRKDPLVGGISVGVVTKPFWRGTLGAIVFDRTDGRSLVLSNQHVLDAPVGTDVIQPAPVTLDDSVEVGFQLDICNPIHFVRLDTPNTTVGTVLAGGAAAAALAAALSDTIDPTRRGQEATVPAEGALTVGEQHGVQLHYPELPIPGTPFRVDTKWSYTRITDAGDATHDVAERRRNEHLLIDKLLLTDQHTYGPQQTIRLFGMFLPPGCAPDQADESQDVAPIVDRGARGPQVADSGTSRLVATGAPPPLTQVGAGRPEPAVEGERALAATAGKGCRCDRYHAVAILTPTRIDRAFPVVLKEVPAACYKELVTTLVSYVRDLEDEDVLRRVMTFLRYGCLRYGEMSVVGLPTGPWKHYLHVQTVNIAPEGMNPLQAARIIGGLPVSQNMAPNVDVACGPFVLEDGEFDIAPI